MSGKIQYTSAPPDGRMDAPTGADRTRVVSLGSTSKEAEYVSDDLGQSGCSAVPGPALVLSLGGDRLSCHSV